MSWMDNYRRSREDGTYFSDGLRYRNNAIDEIVRQNYKKWMHKDELEGVLKDIAELLNESDVLDHDAISSLEYAREDILNRLENLDNEDKIEIPATGIHNPADYLPAMKVGDAYEKQTVYEDIDGDGDTDKITIEEKA
jgi:hypothetical protein